MYTPGLCIDTAGVQFIELDPRKPTEDDKKVSLDFGLHHWKQELPKTHLDDVMII